MRASKVELVLRPGLPATAIDGELMRATRARSVVSRTLAFYLDEMCESGKYAEMGYSCIAHYASHRLGIDPRRARELYQAGRVLMERPLIDEAFLAGALDWTKTELLTHGVREHQQDEWVECAKRVTCSELKRLLMRHRKGLSVRGAGAEAGPEGGLPGTEEAMIGKFSSQRIVKLEKIREDLMRRRGELVDDAELMNHILDTYQVKERDVKREADLAAECEQKVAPEWLRHQVMARDGHRCAACDSGDRLQVHHLVFRRHGGLTREDNLSTVCNLCHGLIHEGRLFARRSEEGSLAFTNRFGDVIRQGQGSGSGSGAAVGGSLSPAVLRVLQGPLNEGHAGGGQAPRSAKPSDCDHSKIPDAEMGEWLKARLHLCDFAADGSLRWKKSALRSASRGGTRLP